MRFLSIMAAGALAVTGIAVTPAPAEARTYVSVGFSTPYYGGYGDRGYRFDRGYRRGYDRGYYGRPYYGRGYDRRGYYDRGWRGRTVCRENRWGRVRCFRR